MTPLALSSPAGVRAVLRAPARSRASRAAPRSARSARAAADGAVEIVRDDESRALSAPKSAVSEGLAISGAVMALNGGLGSFTVREDVAVSRSDENGRTTVTIKARGGVCCAARCSAERRGRKGARGGARGVAAGRT